MSQIESHAVYVILALVTAFASGVAMRRRRWIWMAIWAVAAAIFFGAGTFILLYQEVLERLK